MCLWPGIFSEPERLFKAFSTDVLATFAVDKKTMPSSLFAIAIILCPKIGHDRIISLLMLQERSASIYVRSYGGAGFWFLFLFA